MQLTASILATLLAGSAHAVPQAAQ
eukprot:SAG22_NODE_13429_length_407_cov_0.837662_1_plen_24_part_10